MQMNGIVQGIPMASVKPVGSSPVPVLEMHHYSGAGVNANAVDTAAPCASRPSGIGLQVLHKCYISTFLHASVCEIINELYLYLINFHLDSHNVRMSRCD